MILPSFCRWSVCLSAAGEIQHPALLSDHLGSDPEFTLRAGWVWACYLYADDRPEVGGYSERPQGLHRLWNELRIWGRCYVQGQGRTAFHAALGGGFLISSSLSVVIFVTADDTFIVIIDIVDWLEHSPCNVESSPLRWLMMWWWWWWWWWWRRLWWWW